MVDAETVATAALAGVGHDVDQGPSIVVTPNGKIAVSYVSAMPEQHAKLMSPYCLELDLDQQTRRGLHARAAGVRARRGPVPVPRPRLNIHFGYRAHLAGRPWSGYNELTTSPRDGAASVRWDPLHETTANIIDASYFDEDVRHDRSFVAELYYVAVKPEVATGPIDTTPPTVSIAAPAAARPSPRPCRSPRARATRPASSACS